MSLRTFLIGICVLSFQVCISQEFKSYKEIKALMNVNIAQLEDSLLKRGFQFEKSEGNLFRYKKNSNSIEFKVNPKEIIYTTFDRSFYLNTYSDIESDGFKFIQSDEELIVQNKPIKVDHLKKDELEIFLWNITEGSPSKIGYSLKIKNAGSSSTQVENKIQNKSAEKLEATLIDFTNAFQGGLLKKKEEPKLIRDTTGGFMPKPLQFYISLGFYRFNPSLSVSGSSTHLNYQIGYQKSTFHKVGNKKKWLSDAGVKVDFSYMPGIEYTTTDNSTSLKMWKCFMVFNQYTTVKVKSFDLQFQGGFFLNYNYGRSLIGSEVSAGFWDVGFHFGEQIQKKLGRTPEGYPAMVFGLGFDHYFDISGCYIGSFGLSLGF